jgi:HlyD family secretion protein
MLPSVTTQELKPLEDLDARALPAPVEKVAPFPIPSIMKPQRRTFKWLALIAIALAAGIAVYAWRLFAPPPLPAGIVMSNGRLEAVQVDIATKLAGRIESVLVREGDLVSAGQIVARMDTRVLDAQRHEAEAGLSKARTSIDTARALVDQRRSELELAQSVLKRSEELVSGGFVSSQKLDADRAQMRAAAAALAAAKSQVLEAGAAAGAALATQQRIDADIADSVLKSPTTGRAQYRLAEPGEVLAAGGKVINLLDATDVYMTLFLPETAAGQVAVGAETRVVLDAAPEFVIPAHVTFVASEAQFTPKTVETATERQKFTFRVKASIDPEALKLYQTRFKAGQPGVAYVRVDPKVSWPSTLAVKLPPS